MVFPTTRLEQAERRHVLSRRHFLLQAATGLGMGGLLTRAQPGIAAAVEQPSKDRHTAAVPFFGTQATLILIEPEKARIETAIRSAFAELRQVEKILSLYDPRSELSRLNREGALDRPHAFLVKVLQQAQMLSELTHGAFDVTVQPLWELYAKAKRLGRLPSDTEIQSARRKVNWEKLSVSAQRVHLQEPGMAVTLNALAQGFATDRVIRVLKDHSIHHALVNTGEVGALGRKEDGHPWTIGIQHPRQANAYAGLVKIADRCMATSGDYATRFSDDYVRHHIFNPATGQSPPELASVTVLAPRGLLADGLSTAILVLGQVRGFQLLRSFPGTEALVINKDGRTAQTPNFPLVDRPD